MLDVAHVICNVEPAKQIRRNAPKRFALSLSLSFEMCNNSNGTHGGAVGSGTALQTGRSRARFPMVSMEFFIDIILPSAL